MEPFVLITARRKRIIIAVVGALIVIRPGSGLFGYENQREIMRTTFALLKNQSDSPAGLGSMAALPKSFRNWMDFSLLPDYDQVSKYFYFSVFGGSTTVDGLSFKAFAPRPPQAK